MFKGISSVLDVFSIGVLFAVIGLIMQLLFSLLAGSIVTIFGILVMMVTLLKMEYTVLKNDKTQKTTFIGLLIIFLFFAGIATLLTYDAATSHSSYTDRIYEPGYNAYSIGAMLDTSKKIIIALKNGYFEYWEVLVLPSLANYTYTHGNLTITISAKLRNDASPWELAELVNIIDEYAKWGRCPPIKDPMTLSCPKYLLKNMFREHIETILNTTGNPEVIKKYLQHALGQEPLIKKYYNLTILVNKTR